MSHAVRITNDNPALADLKLSWNTAIFSDEDGLAPMDSLHQAGDAMVALARLDNDGTTVMGSGVMVGPGLMLTATHVLEEFPQDGGGPVGITFLPEGARAWRPINWASVSRPHKYDESRVAQSDMSLVSCTLISDAHAECPLTLAPMKVALPLIGDRLWAVGFRHEMLRNRASHIIPYLSSGLVTAAFPNGRGERMPSPCFEVAMETPRGDERRRRDER